MTGAMRFAATPAAVLAVCVALASGCGNKSKLDVERGASVDALWELAPDGTRFAIVASPRAVGLGFAALAAVRELANQPDFTLVKPQIDTVAKAMFGSETATPEDAGFAPDRAFAMFDTGDGVVGVMPVGDRDKFMAAKHGTRGSAEDTLDGTTCRTRGAHYVCATNVAMFDRIGKGSLRGKIASVLGGGGRTAGTVARRGDAELYIAALPLLSDSDGELALAAQLEPGAVSLVGRWAGTPTGPLATLSGSTAPHPDTSGVSGFVAFDVAPLLEGAPALPIAGGVTFAQLAGSLLGPVSATIPAGSVDIQVVAPLSDPRPAQTVIDNCKDVGTFFELAKTQTPGACRLVLQGTNALELDVWVEGNTLRLGAHKGPIPEGKPDALTPAGRELAGGTWTAAFWGRGTMLNLDGVTPAAQDAPPEVALSIHAMALVNELGAAARIDHDGIRFRIIARTAWKNPPALVHELVAISGNDIVTGKATAPAAVLAATAGAGSPFAADYAAGQGGLMIPAAMIGLVSAVVIPAVMRMVGAGGEDTSGLGPAMNQSDLVTLLLRAYMEEAYPKWQADHPNQKCPATLDEVAAYFGDNPGIPTTVDAWGNAIVMTCNDTAGFKVSSLGADGKPNTADDVHP